MTEPETQLNPTVPQDIQDAAERLADEGHDSSGDLAAILDWIFGLCDAGQPAA